MLSQSHERLEMQQRWCERLPCLCHHLSSNQVAKRRYYWALSRPPHGQRSPACCCRSGSRRSSSTAPATRAVPLGFLLRGRSCSVSTALVWKRRRAKLTPTGTRTRVVEGPSSSEGRLFGKG